MLWIVQFINASENYGLNRFGLKPRALDGLWGIVTEPFLHQSYGHLLSNTVPLLAIGWTLLLSGVRLFLFVTGLVVALGDVLDLAGGALGHGDRRGERHGVRLARLPAGPRLFHPQDQVDPHGDRPAGLFGTLLASC